MVPWKASLMNQLRQPAKLCTVFTTHVGLFSNEYYLR